LLRAALCDAGFDAIGATTLSGALRHAPADVERGPVRLLVVDGRAALAEPAALEQARLRYPDALLALIQRAGTAPAGPWAAILRRPLTIGEIVVSVRRLVPLPAS